MEPKISTGRQAAEDDVFTAGGGRLVGEGCSTSRGLSQSLLGLEVSWRLETMAAQVLGARMKRIWS